MKCLSTSLALAIVLATGLVAEAVTITNVTQGNTVIFYDDFEGLGDTVSTVPAYDGSGDFDPVASVGSWYLEEFESNASTPAPGETQVTNSTTAPDPLTGAFQGNNYLRFYRDDANDYTNSTSNATFTSPQSTDGDLIRLSTMVWLADGTPNARAQIMMVAANSASATARAWIRPDGNGGVDAVVNNGAGLVAVDTGLNYLTGVWQEWVLEYEVGATTFSVAVGGSALVTGFNSAGSGTVVGVDFVNGAGSPAGSFYLDAVPVPEPSSLALLLCGGIGLAAVARKRRGQL